MMFLVSEVHPFDDGNGRVARVMMNAELVAAGETRILIPIVYRSNYLEGLKALTLSENPATLVRSLDFAQRYSAAIPWDGLERAIAVESTLSSARRLDREVVGSRKAQAHAHGVAGGPGAP